MANIKAEKGDDNKYGIWVYNYGYTVSGETVEPAYLPELSTEVTGEILSSLQAAQTIADEIVSREAEQNNIVYVDVFEVDDNGNQKVDEEYQQTPEPVFTNWDKDTQGMVEDEAYDINELTPELESSQKIKAYPRYCPTCKQFGPKEIDGEGNKRICEKCGNETTWEPVEGSSKIKSAMNEYDVWLDGEKIDTVFNTSEDEQEVRRGLINHDGYDSNIEVFKRKKTKASSKIKAFSPESINEEVMSDASDEEKAEYFQEILTNALMGEDDILKEQLNYLKDKVNQELWENVVGLDAIENAIDQMERELENRGVNLATVEGKKKDKKCPTCGK